MKKLKPYKYTLIGVVGLGALLTGIFIDSGFARGFGYYFLAWALLSDILSNLTWQKHTTIHTQKVDYYHVTEEETPHETS